MSENTEAEIGNEQEAEEAIDPIEVIYVGECESLSGRSMLTFEIGKNTEDGAQHIRVSGNSNGGMFSKQWISTSDLQDIIIGNEEITAKSIQPLYGNTSINSAGFCLASLRQIGLVEINPLNTRFHRHISRAIFVKLVQDHMAAESKEQEPKPGGKKGRGL
jgi:hypothetical protein